MFLKTHPEKVSDIDDRTVLKIRRYKMGYFQVIREIALGVTHDGAALSGHQKLLRKHVL